MKNSLAESEKMEDVGEKKAIVGKSPKMMNNDELSKKKGKKVETLLARIPKPLLLFPQRIKKKEDEKFTKSMALLKKLSINICCLNI